MTDGPFHWKFGASGSVLKLNSSERLVVVLEDRRFCLTSV